MIARYLEDLNVGDCFSSDKYVVTEKGIIEFAREFDPQPFHLDSEAARQSVFGSLTASGWHTASIAMRLFVTCGMNPVGGAIGLGVDEMRWPAAVHPGDTLQAQIEILELRPSLSKPGFGIVRFRNATTNQKGELVLIFIASALIQRRPSGSES